MWRDTSDLWPGEDWRLRIRSAITKNALVFLACFSEASEGRETSGQNEELNLAVDQLRLRRPSDSWLIPVRFDAVEIPELEIGGGRTLASIQRVDLLADDWDQGSARLTASVLRVLDQNGEAPSPPSTRRPSESTTATLKAALRDPSGDIALNDVLVPLAREANLALNDDERFPSSDPALHAGNAAAAVFITGAVDHYFETMTPALDALAVAARWVTADQQHILTRFVERLVAATPARGGMVVLLDLRYLPLVLTEYVAALASILQENFGALRATLVDARVRDEGARVPLASRGYPWRPFTQLPAAAQLLAARDTGQELLADQVEAITSGRSSQRYTPVSDFLLNVLRPTFIDEVSDETEYEELFDRAELFIGVISADLRIQGAESGTYLDGPYGGRATWRERYHSPGQRTEAMVYSEFAKQGAEWAPLRAGLFGGSTSRATIAFESYGSEIESLRARRV